MTQTSTFSIVIWKRATFWNNICITYGGSILNSNARLCHNSRPIGLPIRLLLRRFVCRWKKPTRPRLQCKLKYFFPKIHFVNFTIIYSIRHWQCLREFVSLATGSINSIMQRVSKKSSTRIE